MTRLSANAHPFSKTATYAHEARTRVSFGGITACRRFHITPEERSVRMWAWDKGGDEGMTLQPQTKSITYQSYTSKIKAQDSTSAAPFEVPPEPMPTDLHKRVTWRETQDMLTRQKAENIPTPPAYNPNNQLPRLYATGSPAWMALSLD